MKHVDPEKFFKNKYNHIVKKVNRDHILQNKYNYLLMTQIIILVAYPMLASTKTRFPFIPLLLLIAIIPALWVGLSRRLFLSVMSIGVIAFVIHLLDCLGTMNLGTRGILVLMFLYAVFYFLAIAILIKKISSSTIVTADTIKGGISIYILLGLLWADLYMIVLMFDPNAISNISSIHEIASFECYYYSFVTLTTLGYGDFVPVAKYARILAIMEAVTGPVYLAIFVAQIIGLNIAQKMKN